MNKLWYYFEKLTAFLYWFPLGLAVFFLVSVTGLVFINTVLRPITVLPMIWLEDIAMYVVAWSVFILLGAVARRDEHIRVGFFAEKLLGEQRAKSLWTTLENVVGLGFACFLTYHSYRYVVNTYEMHTIRYVGTSFSYALWIPRIVVPLGAGILAVLYLERTLRQLRSFKAARRSERQTHDEESVADNGQQSVSSINQMG
ncbi:TRAP transporter small permease [Chloroflexota bacterium]